MKKDGFTLAEIMIALVIIGVLVAILLPAARNIMPNENIVKFKKAHNVFYNAIMELVTSDAYFKDGDLGVRYDGEGLQNNDGEREYACLAIADILNAKSIDCSTGINMGCGTAVMLNGANLFYATSQLELSSRLDVTASSIQKAKELLDANCKAAQYGTSCPSGNTDTTAGSTTKVQPEIVLNDGTIFHFSRGAAFGAERLVTTTGVEGNTPYPCGSNCLARYFSSPKQYPANFSDKNGHDVAYRGYCIDIDGFAEGEDPFGYGIRADGKILDGARATEWLEKTIQGKE